MTAVHKLPTFRNLLNLLTNPPDRTRLREQTGDALLSLFKADYFASYIWNHQRQRYDDGVMLNMSADNLENYRQYFQFNDPITPALQRRRKATDVGEIMSYASLRKQEFYNDFLKIDGLYYGINAHAFDRNQHVGDIRLWRARHRRPFDDQDLEMLEFIRPLYANALRNAENPATDENANGDTLGPLMARFELTRREAETAHQLCMGLSDQQIADRLDIGYTTVRSHIKHLYRKLDVHSRSAALAKLHS